VELPERITSKIDRSEPCWKWLASHTGEGRPQVMLNGKMWLVYRLLYTAEVGPIPDGLTLDHVVCQHGWCCNPAHCEPVPNGTNVSRALAIRWGGRDACPQGHPFAEYRRYRKSGKYEGNPYCVKCGSDRVREWYRKKAAINKQSN
jgi:hypothetical protein